MGFADFDNLYRLHAPKMVCVAAAAVDRDTAEDLVQTVFVLYLAKFDALGKHENHAAWLYKTLRNLLANELRRKRRTELPLAESLIAKDSNEQASMESHLPKGLSKADREILLLLYDEELDYEEVAARLNCSVLACRTRVFRAKERCRNLILAGN